MANDGTVKIGTELDDSGFKSGLSKLGSVASTALKGGVSVIGSVATAAAGAAAGLLALESATEEYRVAQGKLNTAFEAAGYGTDAAAQAYSAFYGILGDTDTATEASQLLAKLAQSEEDIANWTDIAAGVWGTFGDSLPIEGLIEASNETAKTGTVVGVLADALNWAGISEDEFNDKLAAAGSEAERNQLIMDTLSGTYDDATEAFYKNNAALVASREAQAQMDAALAELGGAVSDVKTRMTAEFLPAISDVTAGLSGMLTGTEGAEEQFSEGIGNLIDSAVERLPEFLDFGVQILTSILEGILENIPTLVEAIPTIIESIVVALQELWPTIQTTGAELLTMLTNGIIETIPELVSKLPDIIVAIVNFLTENFPQILEKGSEMLEKFAFGIIEAIPDLVARLPEVISSITNFFTTNAPTIVRTGAELLGKLIVGIIGSIPEIAANLPQVISAIVSALRAGLDQIKNVGRYLIEGLWNGISSKVDWLSSKVRGIGSSIINAAKSALGIHSPSTVMRDQIGKNIGLGVAAGITDSVPAAVQAANDMAADISKHSALVSRVNASMTPAYSPAPASYSAISDSIGSGSGILTELQSINAAIREGKVLMVDKRVLGKVASDANRSNTRMTGVTTY